MSKTISASELSGFLDGIVKQLEKPKAINLLSKWNDELAGDLAEGFLNSKSPEGKAWAPLKYPRPPGHNPGTRPLIDTGQLMQSVISDSKGHIEIVSSDSTTFGTSVFYAGFHQFGTTKIPARPFLGVPPKSLDAAIRMLGDHFISVIDAI